MDGTILDEGLSVKELITQLRSFGVPDETLNILEGKGTKSVSSAKKSVIRSNYYRRNNWIQKFANSFSVCYNYYFQKMCIDALPFGFRSLG